MTTSGAPGASTLRSSSSWTRPRWWSAWMCEIHTSCSARTAAAYRRPKCRRSEAHVPSPTSSSAPTGRVAAAAVPASTAAVALQQNRRDVAVLGRHRRARAQEEGAPTTPPPPRSLPSPTRRAAAAAAGDGAGSGGRVRVVGGRAAARSGCCHVPGGSCSDGGSAQLVEEGGQPLELLAHIGLDERLRHALRVAPAVELRLVVAADAGAIGRADHPLCEHVGEHDRRGHLGRRGHRGQLARRPREKTFVHRVQLEVQPRRRDEREALRLRRVVQQQLPRGGGQRGAQKRTYSAVACHLGRRQVHDEGERLRAAAPTCAASAGCAASGRTCAADGQSTMKDELRRARRQEHLFRAHLAAVGQRHRPSRAARRAAARAARQRPRRPPRQTSAPPARISSSQHSAGTAVMALANEASVRGRFGAGAAATPSASASASSGCSSSSGVARTPISSRSSGGALSRSRAR